MLRRSPQSPGRRTASPRPPASSWRAAVDGPPAPESPQADGYGLEPHRNDPPPAMRNPAAAWVCGFTHLPAHKQIDSYCCRDYRHSARPNRDDAGFRGGEYGHGPHPSHSSVEARRSFHQLAGWIVRGCSLCRWTEIGRDRNRCHDRNRCQPPCRHSGGTRTHENGAPVKLA
jgi:hypothetical protein